MLKKDYSIHFVGIGGIGMSGIAELLLNLGYRVSGSDIAGTDITRRLELLGAKIFKGHSPDNIGNADVVVHSSAISPDNPEISAAKAVGLPVIPRAEMLAELMRLKHSICISGSHGKTTTTSMVAEVLAKGGLDPTVVIGGKLKSAGTNALLGAGDFIVAEADESDGSFLKYTPSVAVVTNIDAEHLDYYDGIDEIVSVFARFIDQIPFYGLAVLCLDDPRIQQMLPDIRKRYVTYGMNPQADFYAIDIKTKGVESCFKVYFKREALGKIRLPLPGLHNVANALAAVAVAMELGVSFKKVAEGLNGLGGVQRRLESKGEVNGIMIIDDYGHHPTEIRATLAAVRSAWPGRRLVVAFQPHRYTRTRALFHEFARSFYDSDSLLILPVYPASEPPIPGIDHVSLAEAVKSHGHRDVSPVSGIEDAVQAVVRMLKPEDIFLTLGAGNVWQVADQVMDYLSTDDRR